MRTLDIIAAKRDGRELAAEHISRIVLDYASGVVPDYQMSAFLMAAYIRGLSFDETVALTGAMVASGKVLDLSPVPGTKVDKHSTGGVGDKTTLIVVPILAACGLKAPKMSGRGLGFTGGTLDKLESIPGFSTSLSMPRIISQLRDIGAVMAGQSPDIVPADKRIYALRDVTATVESLSLVAASVMSKKIACGSDVIVLDVKAGSGAFMRDLSRARDLARTMMEIGRGFGRKTVAAITDMNQPLGRAVGNAMEVAEAVETLHGGGPSDLRELSLRLSAITLEAAGLGSHDDCLAKVEEALRSGAAADVFRRIIEAQGGDPAVLDDPSLLPSARQTIDVPSPATGVVSAIDCARLGAAAGILGAGRERKEDTIDPAVGLIVRKKLGDNVTQGDPLVTLHINQPDRLDSAAALVREAYAIGEAAEVPPLIHEVLRWG